jgi:outer membrane protein insertion porin family
LRIIAGLALRVALAVALLSAVVPFASTVAQIPSGGTIEEIRIEGSQRVDPGTVRSYLLVQPGDPFDSDRIDRSLKALFATGLFSDVSLKREGNVLIVRVVENPVVNRIAFEGNHKLSDSTLTDEIQLRARTVYTRQKVQSDVQRILDLYRRNGRFAATVDPKVIRLAQNRVDLVYEINEGPVTGINSINFIGNEHFSASKLREVISTRESRWWRFLSSADNYDPDRMNYDRELLRKFYLSEGYADFRVVSAVAELAPTRDGFLITFTVEEGQRYRFGKINITNQLKDVNPDQLRPLLTTAERDWYNADAIDASIKALTDALGNRGYAFVDIQPQARRNPDTHTIDVTYNIKEGPRVYVERININGNVRTKDQVIRRELRIVEGDAFNSAKLQRSEQRIKNLDFFSKVETTHTAGSAPDKTIINVDVSEKSTGEFSVGVGFSTTDGPLANIGVHERNLLGEGLDLRLDTLVAFRTQQIDLSYTDPYFLNRNLAAGFDLFAMTQDNTTFAGYEQFTMGGTLRAGYQISEALRQTVSYTLRQDRIFNVQSNASYFIADQVGARNSSIVSQSLLYDMRDNRQDPTAGYFASVTTDAAGLGGQARYLRVTLHGGYFHSWAPQYVWSLTGEGGDILGIGEGVAIEDRFFVGGDNLRGFATGGIGPREINSDDALGGNSYYVGSVTQGFPVGLPQEFGVTGRVFSDFGSLWGLDQTGPTVKDIAAIRVSAGVGVSWASPFGPIRLDLGHPVLKQSYDKNQIFRVSFGTRF